jgi:hypothetical protein
MAIVAHGYGRRPVGGTYVAVGDVTLEEDVMVATIEPLDETADLPEDLTATLVDSTVGAELATDEIDAELDNGIQAAEGL